MHFIVLSLLGGLALVAAQSTVVSSAPGAEPTTYVTGRLGDAAVVTDNPIGDVYSAVLPESSRTSIRGYISGSSEDGTGVRFNVSFTGFPDLSLGPFIYHIHDQPISSDGNCTTAKAHQDPYIRGEIPPCDPTKPQTCQVGDLSGKYGNITTSSYSTSYVDLYASTKQGIGAFFGNRSIVVHTANTTRLTCANFTLVASGNNNGTNLTTPTSPGGYSTGTPVPFTGSASTTAATLMTVFFGVAVAAFLM